jgi:hypothetical protein
MAKNVRRLCASSKKREDSQWATKSPVPAQGIQDACTLALPGAIPHADLAAAVVHMNLSFKPSY